MLIALITAIGVTTAHRASAYAIIENDFSGSGSLTLNLEAGTEYVVRCSSSALTGRVSSPADEMATTQRWSLTGCTASWAGRELGAATVTMSALPTFSAYSEREVGVGIFSGTVVHRWGALTCNVSISGLTTASYSVREGRNQLAGTLLVSGTREASCPATGFLFATGQLTASFTEPQFRVSAISTRWNLQAIETRLASEALLGISCATSSSCAAVGLSGLAGEGFATARAFTWNGTTWSAASSPQPAGSVWAAPQDVSCPSSTVCVAVGGYVTETEPNQPYSARWNGREWAVETLPMPAGVTVAMLNDVSCVTTTNCVAAGTYIEARGVWLSLVESWNGREWTVQTTPNQREVRRNIFQSISCSSSTSCTAAGYTETGGGRTLPFAEQWNGTTWTIQSTPLPSGGVLGSFDGVSCTGSSACTAVGEYRDATRQMGWAARWDGSRWTQQSVPLPPSTLATHLNDVSCKSATTCTAVGNHVEAGGKEATFAADWGAGRWTLTSSLNPGARGNLLMGVACLRPYECRAAGFTENAGQRGNMAQRYS